VIDLLPRGTAVDLPRHGGTWRVGALLGEGGQGAVFELERTDVEASASLALKWYRPEAAHPAQLAALNRLAHLPAPSEAFLWPIEVLDGAETGFGYVMPLRPEGYLPIADLLTGRADASFSTVAKLCMGLADCFLKLHAQGLCYRDISLGNVFFDPATGQPLVCDNDNVGIDGRDPARVLGTSRFMAPEVVSGAAQPSTATDLYSLSVLIFYLLMFHHPLQGRRELEHACFDRDAEKRLFGTEPLFIFDPVDHSNAPDPVVHGAVLDYWPLYPKYLQDDFVRAFTVGLRDPSRRVREGVWRSHLSRLLDGIVECACGRENLTDDGVPTAACWACHQPLPTPVRLQIGGRVLVLNNGTYVTRHHLRRDYAYHQVVGQVVQHPERRELWGLRNLGSSPWQVTDTDGTQREVAAGRSFGLVLGATIDFGGVTGVLKG
jgi:serine/threonine protein kinase